MLWLRRSMFSAILHLNGCKFGAFYYTANQLWCTYDKSLILLISSSFFFVRSLSVRIFCSASRLLCPPSCSSLVVRIPCCRQILLLMLSAPPTLPLSWFSWDCKWNLQHKRIWMCVCFPHFITLLQFLAIKILLQIQSLILHIRQQHTHTLLSIGIQIFTECWNFTLPVLPHRFFRRINFSGFVANGSFSISTYDCTMENAGCALYSIWNSIFGSQRNTINVHFNMLIWFLIEFVKIVETFTSPVYPCASLSLASHSSSARPPATISHISDRLTVCLTSLFPLLGAECYNAVGEVKWHWLLAGGTSVHLNVHLFTYGHVHITRRWWVELIEKDDKLKYLHTINVFDRTS